MTRRAPPAIIVVGGGFSGAAVALHLLRDHPDLDAPVEIIEPRPLLGAGLAYSTADPAHRINVAAARMAVFADDETHFDAWLRAGGHLADDPAAALPDGRLYPRRMLFGRYVDETLRAAGGERLRHIRDQATAAARDGSGYRIALASGAARRAGLLVLAVGHPPPALPAGLRAVAGDARVIADPADAARLAAIPAGARVLIVGTGLTMGDVVASLRGQGHHGPLLAISRRGLLSRPRTVLPVSPAGDFASHPEATARGLLRRVRRAVADEAAAGRPWENVIDALRRQAGTVWPALPPAEQARLLRHLRPFWDVHRFQCAPQVDGAVQAARAAGQLTVLAASVTGAAAEAGGVVAQLRRRGGAAWRAEVDFVVNCTGPGHRSVVGSNPVLASLAAAGMLAADGLGLGVLTDARSRAIGADGAPRDDLYVAGPLARAAHGELMGLPQVSIQPQRIAAELAARLRGAA